jgi:hypothetical protein
MYGCTYCWTDPGGNFITYKKTNEIRKLQLAELVGLRLSAGKLKQLLNPTGRSTSSWPLKFAWYEINCALYFILFHFHRFWTYPYGKKKGFCHSWQPPVMHSGQVWADVFVRWIAFIWLCCLMLFLWVMNQFLTAVLVLLRTPDDLNKPCYAELFVQFIPFVTRIKSREFKMPDINPFKLCLVKGLMKLYKSKRLVKTNSHSDY